MYVKNGFHGNRNMFIYSIIFDFKEMNDIVKFMDMDINYNIMLRSYFGQHPRFDHKFSII